MVKKEPGIVNKTAVHENFASILPNSLTTATDSGSIHRSFLLALIEQHKLVCLENLANAFPLCIEFASPPQNPEVLVLPQLTTKNIWFP